MRAIDRAVSFAGLLSLAVACSSKEPGGGDDGGGGSSAAAGTSMSGGGGTPATGGAGVGGTGQGGASGVATGGSTTGGSATAGAATGGSATGGSETGGSTTGGVGGAGAAAGSGAAGTGSGGTSVGGAGSGDSYVSGVTVTVHSRVRTILNVAWNQTTAADQTLLEFTFESGNVLRSRAKPGTVGAHTDVALGIPASTLTTIRVISRVGGVDHPSRDYQGTTGALPSGLPVPSGIMHDAQRASPEKWILGAVEDSTGGCGRQCVNDGVFWTYVMDRKGRMVWYYSDPPSNATTTYPRVTRSGGEYFWLEKKPYGGSGSHSIVRLTLDMVLFDEIPIPDLDDCVDVTSDGKVLYDTGTVLKEMTPPRTGTTGATFRDIFSCRTAFGAQFLCYTNTVNWVPADNTVLMSYPDENTISQVRRDNGMLVATYGARTGSYAFSPATSSLSPCSTASPCPMSFEFNHFANITAEGTLMVSSHTPGHTDTYTARANEHSFQEWTIDRTSRTLTQKWLYKDGPEWAMYKGEAVKLANGNVLANYGSGGVIREITQDKTTVFYAKFDVSTGDDFYNKFVGHQILIADLYALNGGLPPP